jgi:hypothetical protein
MFITSNIWHLGGKISINKDNSGRFIIMVALLESAWKEKIHFMKQHSKWSAYPIYNIPMIASKITRRISAANCVPIPTRDERRTRFLGGLKTSPCTSFHPDSSLTSLSWCVIKYISKKYNKWNNTIQNITGRTLYAYHQYRKLPEFQYHHHHENILHNHFLESASISLTQVQWER